jgi:hypothetical protein
LPAAEGIGPANHKRKVVPVKAMPVKAVGVPAEQTLPARSINSCTKSKKLS